MEKLYAILLAFSVGLLLVLSPKMHSRWSGAYREGLWDTFLSDVKSSGYVNPKTFWEFREKFSPGYFEFNDEVITISETFRLKRLYPFPTWILKFHSPQMESIDEVVESANLDQFMTHTRLPSPELRSNLIVDEPTVKVFTSGDDTYLVFLVPIEQMKQANGFFDYLPPEEKLLNNQYWLSLNRLQL